MATAALYVSDPIKFSRLCLWVYRQQKAGCSDQDITEALKKFYPHKDRVVPWWPYLTKILESVRHEGLKKADLTTAREVLRDFFGFRQ